MNTKKIPLLWESNLVDIFNDKGFKKISSIIDRAPENVVSSLRKVIDKQITTGISKEASEYNSNSYLFTNTNKMPINSKEDILISKLYLEDQRSNIPTDIYKEASDKLDSLLHIFEVPEEQYNWINTMQKTASATDMSDLLVYLLPKEQLFPVYSKRDLIKVASVYTDNEDKFFTSQKVEFARNFVKKAMNFDDVHIPNNIAKYASALGTDFADTYIYLEKRADWVEIHHPTKKDVVSKLRKLASDLKEISLLPEKEQVLYKDDINNLNKLAYSIHEIDMSMGIDSKQYKKGLFPDAFGTVFNKVAGEVIARGYTANDTPGMDSKRDSDKISDINGIDKGMVVSALGEEVLEDLEDEEGNLDVDKARRLLTQAGVLYKDKNY